MSDLHRPAKLGPHIVPGIWRHMLPPALRDLNFPKERLATCDRCPKTVSDGFRADYRCCTYLPKVPNFLLGLALTDPNSAAFSELLRRPDIHSYLLPDGFQPSPQHWAIFIAETEEGRFGKTDKALCPFLNPADGCCGIYAYRNSVCSTFFCDFEYGGQGRRFWDRLQAVTMQVELALSQWALSASGFCVEDYLARLELLAEDLNMVRSEKSESLGWSKKARSLLWGDWFGHELELYKKCAKAATNAQKDLWEIANNTVILDSQKYECAINMLVPEKYREKLREQAAEHDSVEFEAASPTKLWMRVIKQHRKMWKIAQVKDIKGFFNDGL